MTFDGSTPIRRVKRFTEHRRNRQPNFGAKLSRPGFGRQPRCLHRRQRDGVMPVAGRHVAAPPFIGGNRRAGSVSPRETGRTAQRGIR